MVLELSLFKNKECEKRVRNKSAFELTGNEKRPRCIFLGHFKGEKTFLVLIGVFVARFSSSCCRK